jgi:hypothetical protein
MIQSLSNVENMVCLYLNTEKTGHSEVQVQPLPLLIMLMQCNYKMHYCEALNRMLVMDKSVSHSLWNTPSFICVKVVSLVCSQSYFTCGEKRCVKVKVV